MRKKTLHNGNTTFWRSGEHNDPPLAKKRLFVTSPETLHRSIETLSSASAEALCSPSSSMDYEKNRTHCRTSSPSSGIEYEKNHTAQPFKHAPNREYPSLLKLQMSAKRPNRSKARASIERNQNREDMSAESTKHS